MDFIGELFNSGHSFNTDGTIFVESDRSYEARNVLGEDVYEVVDTLIEEVRQVYRRGARFYGLLILKWPRQNTGCIVNIEKTTIDVKGWCEGDFLERQEDLEDTFGY